MTSYTIKRTQHRKRMLFAKFVTTIGRLLTISNYKSPTQIISIHFKSYSSSIYKSFIKSSFSNLSTKFSNCKFSLTNYKSSKINPVHLIFNPANSNSPAIKPNPIISSNSNPYSKYQKVFVTTRRNAKVET